ncbi:MAG: hydrogenase maturation protease [SAR324 cluster bacterium]
MAKRRPILVLGVGNLLMGDEGVGVHVVRRLLDGASLGPDVQAIDGGTGGFTLLGAMTGTPWAILVDACLDGRPPGTVRVRRPKRAMHFPTALGAHDIGLRALIEAAELLNRLPRSLLLTVSVAAPFEMSVALSPPVAAAVPKAEAWIRRLLAGPQARGSPGTRGGQAPRSSGTPSPLG